MNSKEMQAAIEALIKANHELTVVVESQAERISAMVNYQAQMDHKFEETYNAEQDIKARIDKLAEVMGYDGSDEWSPMYQELTALKEAVEVLRGKSEDRNKSAPLKKNMTDDDARRALGVELQAVDHKAVAEMLGLTYAQVYSCRMGYTFKHVHKEMRDAGIVLPWKR